MGFNFCLIFPKLSASKRRRLNLERETRPCKCVSPCSSDFFAGAFFLSVLAADASYLAYVEVPLLVTALLTPGIVLIRKRR